MGCLVWVVSVGKANGAPFPWSQQNRKIHKAYVHDTTCKANSIDAATYACACAQPSATAFPAA